MQSGKFEQNNRRYIIRREKLGLKSDSDIFASVLFLQLIRISLENWKAKEFDGF